MKLDFDLGINRWVLDTLDGQRTYHSTYVEALAWLMQAGLSH